RGMTYDRLHVQIGILRRLARGQHLNCAARVVADPRERVAVQPEPPCDVDLPQHVAKHRHEVDGPHSARTREHRPVGPADPTLEHIQVAREETCSIIVRMQLSGGTMSSAPMPLSPWYHTTLKLMPDTFTSS